MLLLWSVSQGGGHRGIQACVSLHRNHMIIYDNLQSFTDSVMHQCSYCFWWWWWFCRSYWGWCEYRRCNVGKASINQGKQRGKPMVVKRQKELRPQGEKQGSYVRTFFPFIIQMYWFWYIVFVILTYNVIFDEFFTQPPMGRMRICFTDVFFCFLFFCFLFFSVRQKNTRQPFSGTAERIFMKLLPNDSGENVVSNVVPKWGLGPK